MCMGTSFAHLPETFKKNNVVKPYQISTKNESKLKDTKWKKKTLFQKKFAIIFAVLLQYYA